MATFMDNARALLARLLEEDDDSSSDEEEGDSRAQPRAQQQRPQVSADTSALVVDLTASDDARDEEEEAVERRRAAREGDTDTDEDKDDEDEAGGGVFSMSSASEIGSRFRGIIVDDGDSDGDDDDAVFDVTPNATGGVPLPPSAADRVVRKRPRNEMSSRESDDVVVVETRVVLKAQPTECTICIDACTLSGPHRLVALKCGHLFGKMCIERWVLTRRACPICNLAVRKPDIRALFSDHVAVVDNSGLVEMTEKYESEKAKRIELETALAQTKQQLLEEIQSLRREAVRLTEGLSSLQAGAAKSPPKSKPRWK